MSGNETSRRVWLLVGIFSLIPLLNFPRALLSDRTLFLRDIGMVWAPQVESVVRQVSKGEFPGFDARRAFGQPLFADPRSEVLYPPAWIHWVLPAATSYPLFCAFHLVVAAMGAARLTRRLIPEAGLVPLLVAGFAYGAGGPMLSLVSHWHHLAAAAWMPWIVERVCAGADERPKWVSLPLLVALQIFAGSPDYSFGTVVLCLLALCTRNARSGKERLWTLAPLGLGVALAAVQLLPSFAFAREAGRDPLPVGWSISPLTPALAVETVLPVRLETWPLRPEARVALLGDTQVWMLSHYLGLSILTLAIAGLLRGGTGGRAFAIGAIVVGFVFASGVRNESLQALIAQIPFVSGLRFPTKHLAAASLGLAVLAARGSMPFAPLRRLSLLAPVALACVAVGAAAFLFNSNTDPAAGFDARALTPLLCATAAFVGTLVATRSGDAGARALPVLIALDLLGAQAAINPTTPAAFFRERPPLTGVIPRDSRIYVSDYSIHLRDQQVRMPAGPPYRLANVPAGYSHPEALALAATWYLNPPSAARFGYFGSYDLDILDFYRRPLKTTVETFATSHDPDFILDALRRGSVDFVVTMDEPVLWSGLRVVTEERRFFEAPVRVFAVPDPWPRVRLETPQGDRASGTARVTRISDGRVEVDVAGSAGARLVLAAAFDPGWRASVDGESVAVSETPMSFVSAPVREGRHTVVLSYRPPLLIEGMVVSALALILVIVLARRPRAEVTSQA